jgi:D-lactate dehydrogenase (cytochrome)/glycolate oxidase
MSNVPSLAAGTRRFLERLFPGDAAAFTPETMFVYGTDASRRFAMPAAVVRPESAGQIKELLAFAQAERVPILPRGRATNTVGDCVPVTGGIVVSTARLNRILDIDGDDFVAEVEPGVVTGDLQTALAPKQLFFAPDPASVKFSTVGGNAATCAGGMRAVKYGVTRDHILGIEAVLPGGETILTGGRTHKNVAGLDLTRLLVGSEGTLAFFTRLFLKLLPLPQATATLALAYPSVDAALTACADVFKAGILPVAMELLARKPWWPCPGSAPCPGRSRPAPPSSCAWTGCLRPWPPMLKLLKPQPPGRHHLATVRHHARGRGRTLGTAPPAQSGHVQGRPGQDQRRYHRAARQAARWPRRRGRHRRGRARTHPALRPCGRRQPPRQHHARRGQRRRTPARLDSPGTRPHVSPQTAWHAVRRTGVGLSKLPFLDRQIAPAERESCVGSRPP